MDPMMISAASGMRARMETLELLANNIANAATAGYKSDREFYNLYVAPEANDGSNPFPTTAPVIGRHWTDFSPGTSNPTGNPLDLALNGKGFFAVDGPGGTLYTRSGSFQISKTGELQTLDGFALRAQGNRHVMLDPSRPVEVSRDGTLLQQGQAVGKLEIADIPKTEDLAKHSGTYFQLNGITPATLQTADIQQGRLENANVQPSESAVRLVTILRQFEMLQKATTVAADMNRRAVEEVARVNS
jgi:flagellar basal-body rod protein FlgF